MVMVGGVLIKEFPRNMVYLRRVSGESLVVVGERSRLGDGGGKRVVGASVGGELDGLDAALGGGGRSCWAAASWRC